MGTILCSLFRLGTDILTRGGKGQLTPISLIPTLRGSYVSNLSLPLYLQGVSKKLISHEPRNNFQNWLFLPKTVIHHVNSEYRTISGWFKGAEIFEQQIEFISIMTWSGPCSTRGPWDAQTGPWLAQTSFERPVRTTLGLIEIWQG